MAGITCASALRSFRRPHLTVFSHLNAIDKDNRGDYLVTARYTDAVYKVSGQDGHIIWSLGGTTSSFRLDGFNFSRPHDARFVSRNATSETITLLDNGGCEESQTSDVSSALIIHLDTSSEDWVATVEKRWTRYQSSFTIKYVRSRTS